MLKNVKCARCVRCGKEYEAVPNLTNCSCGGILDIVYDYDYIKAHLTKETLKNRVNPTNHIGNGRKKITDEVCPSNHFSKDDLFIFYGFSIGIMHREAVW